MTNGKTSVSADKILVLNGWSCPNSLWDEFKSKIDVPVVVLNAHDPIFDHPEWIKKVACYIANNTLVIGWSLGGFRAMVVASYMESAGTPLSDIWVWNCGAAFTQKAKYTVGMSENKFSDFKSLAGEAELLERKFPFLLTQCSSKQKQDLRELKARYLSRTLPSQSALEHGLELLEAFDLRHVLRDLDTQIKFVLGEGDALVDVRTADWLRENCPQHAVKVIQGMGHFPLNEYLNDVFSSCAQLVDEGRDV